MYLNSESLLRSIIIFKLIHLGLGIIISILRLIRSTTFFYELKPIGWLYE